MNKDQSLENNNNTKQNFWNFFYGNIWVIEGVSNLLKRVISFGWLQQTTIIKLNC